MSDIDPSDLERDLAAVLNKHSIDNDLGTPDFMLAALIISNLRALRDMQTRRRERSTGGVLSRLDDRAPVTDRG